MQAAEMRGLAGDCDPVLRARSLFLPGEARRCARFSSSCRLVPEWVFMRSGAWVFQRQQMHAHGTDALFLGAHRFECGTTAQLGGRFFELFEG